MLHRTLCRFITFDWSYGILFAHSVELIGSKGKCKYFEMSEMKTNLFAVVCASQDTLQRCKVLTWLVLAHHTAIMLCCLCRDWQRHLSFWFRYIFEQQVILVDRLAFGPFEYAQQKIHFRFVSNSNHLFLVNLLRQPCVEPEVIERQVHSKCLTCQMLFGA